MLYLVSTPIGNLQDITLRALECLKSCDYILCEDTRHSLKLLNHFDIKKPLYSYHQFSEAAREEKILSDLSSGKNIALISDAGTPAISDPGERLVRACIREGLEVTSCPGPAALIMALVLSGLPTEPFQFLGFLPKKSHELKTLLLEICAYPGTTICYESPNRVSETIEALAQIAPTTKVAIARELTKLHEEIIRGTADELRQTLAQREPLKGEIVLVIAEAHLAKEWEALSVQEHVLKVQKEFNLTKNEAIKMVASLRKVPKREIYRDSVDI